MPHGLVPLALVLVILHFHSSSTKLCVVPQQCFPLGLCIYLFLWNAPPTHRHTQITGTLHVKHQLYVSVLLLPSGILSLLPLRLGYVALITFY